VAGMVDSAVYWEEPGPRVPPWEKISRPSRGCVKLLGRPRISCCALHPGLRSVAPPLLFAIAHQGGQDLVASIYGRSTQAHTVACTNIHTRWAR
jgi:hypothetical protein